VKCQFLENLSLASLVAPVTKEEFLSRYWEKEPLIVHRGDPDYYSGLFSIKDFDEAITRDPAYVKLANATANKNASYKTEMTRGLEAFLADMRDGGTLVLDQLHNKDPNLGILCRVLATEFSHRFQTNLYLTPPKGRGFTPHWDNHDVFILQVEGSKQWNIEKERRAFPKKSANMGDEGRELRGDLHTFTINQGDVVYIPSGFVHAAECGSEPSLHITLGVTAVYLEDLLHAMVRAVVQRDENLRGALPFGFMNDRPDELVTRITEVLRQTADESFLAAFVDEFRDDCVKGYKLDVSGQVVDFLRPSPLLITDIVGPRRGIVYQIHPGEDSVRVNFGARSIDVLGIFKEALDFALKTPSFAIGALPGDLEDVERVVLIERLMQEGLIVRK
jgi:ribosomal protein L16 Arg81 hydroxylase